MQKKAPKKYQVEVFDEFKELAEQRAKEALELLQKKHMLIKWEGERKEQYFCKDWEDRQR